VLAIIWKSTKKRKAKVKVLDSDSSYKIVENFILNYLYNENEKN